MQQGPLFYIPVPDNDHDVAGPYDLVQMARLLRTKVISGETLTHRVGEDDWKPFCETAQYIIAREMPPDAVSTRLEMLKEQDEAKRPPIPIPSAALMLQVGAALVVLLIAGVGIFFVSEADTTVGFFIAVGGSGAALFGQAFILVHLMDETWITRLMVLFIPLFDIYYFTTNLGKYLPFFCAKYIGTMLALAAFAGVSSVDSNLADEMKELLGVAGL